MIFRSKRVGAASRHHHKIIHILYPKRVDSQVTPLGTYKTNYGRKRRVR